MAVDHRFTATKERKTDLQSSNQIILGPPALGKTSPDAKGCGVMNTEYVALMTRHHNDMIQGIAYGIHCQD